MSAMRHRPLAGAVAIAAAFALAACGGGDSTSGKSSGVSAASGASGAKGSADGSTGGKMNIGDTVPVTHGTFVQGSEVFGKKQGELVGQVDTAGLPKGAGLLVTLTAKLKNGQTVKDSGSAVVFRPGEPIWIEKPVAPGAEVESVSGTAMYAGKAPRAPEVEPAFSNFKVDEGRPGSKRVTFDVTNPGSKAWPLLSGSVICFDGSGKPVAAGTGMAEKVGPKSTSKNGYAMISGNPAGAKCSVYAQLTG